jgi:hypothetical protein
MNPWMTPTGVRAKTVFAEQVAVEVAVTLSVGAVVGFISGLLSGPEQADRRRGLRSCRRCGAVSL